MSELRKPGNPGGGRARSNPQPTSGARTGATTGPGGGQVIPPVTPPSTGPNSNRVR